MSSKAEKAAKVFETFTGRKMYALATPKQAALARYRIICKQHRMRVMYRLNGWASFDGYGAAVLDGLDPWTSQLAKALDVDFSLREHENILPDGPIKPEPEPDNGELWPEKANICAPKLR